VGVRGSGFGEGEVDGGSLSVVEVVGFRFGVTVPFCALASA